MAYNPLNNSSVLKRTESCLRFLLAVTILTFSFLVTPCIAQPAELASETFRNDVQFDTQTTQEDQQDNSRFRTPSSTFTINPATVLFGLG
ncbi:MAG: hypothetical protein OEY50_08640, partial [Nitrospinota bacterium]|nr:hypothetical protein [Nitrospinota bacterium]